MAPEAFDAEAILSALVARNVRFVLIGGMAGIVHGSPHLTADVDVTPADDRVNLDRLAGALKDLDAKISTISEPDGLPFDWTGETLSRARVWNLICPAGRFDLAFLPSGTHGYADLHRDSTKELLFGLRIEVASLADIVRSKEAAGRPKDRLTLPTLRAMMDEGFTIEDEDDPS